MIQWHPTTVLLPGKSHGRRSLVGCSPWGCKESDTTERLHFHFSLSWVGEGNGNPLQYSCLENPMGKRNLAGYSPWGCKESDTTEWLSTHIHSVVVRNDVWNDLSFLKFTTSYVFFSWRMFPCALERNVYSFAFEWNTVAISISSFGWMCYLKLVFLHWHCVWISVHWCKWDI